MSKRDPVFCSSRDNFVVRYYSGEVNQSDCPARDRRRSRHVSNRRNKLIVRSESVLCHTVLSVSIHLRILILTRSHI